LFLHFVRRRVVRQAEEEGIRRRAGMVPRRGDRAKE
jgi:hypothetical protein